MSKMFSFTLWVLALGCLATVSTQGPLGFSLPAIMHVERNWYAMPTDPVNTTVTRVHREKTGDQPVTFGLETSGPPAPFSIDPQTGVVKVNDTLLDKENRSYSLWVTAYDGSIPQRTEVLATITDNAGHRPKIPRPPPFSLPPGFPSPKRTTKVPEVFIQESTVPDTTVSIVTKRPPKKPEDAPVSDATTKGPVTGNGSATVDTAEVGSDVPLTIIPLISIGALVVIVAAVILIVWRKNTSSKKSKSKKEDMQKDSNGIVMQDASINAWERPRAYSNRYESWDANHLEPSEETTITEKEEPRDEWEFPRHRLRIFNIVGEGAFGQVWRAQAIDIDDWKYVRPRPDHRCNVYEGRRADRFLFRRDAPRLLSETTSPQTTEEQERGKDASTNEPMNAGVIDRLTIYGKKGEQTVAVKTLKENASEKEKIDLIQELAVMKGLGTHPNVVRLIGCCTEKEPTLVIMEFVSLGKLQQFLRDSRAERHYGNTHGGSKFLTSRDLTHFAFQVARGMEFLTSKGIIHRDLAARNVLITEERTCKVADFGFARDVGGAHVYERKSDGRLPIRWMAPESLYDDIFSVKSDIWSFGVLLWEIVTLGSTPYPGLSAGDVMKKVRGGLRLEKPEHCRRELYNIMYYCWEAEANDRPTFEECVTMLERLLCTETDYIELERFPDHSYYNVQDLEGEKL